MNHWMGQERAKDGFMDFLPWALVGGAVGWGLYMLLKPKPTPEPAPGATRAAPPAPIAPPSRYADLVSVDARFGQVRELYTTGRLGPEQAIMELDGLVAAANTFGTKSAADALEANALIERIAAFRRGVEDYIRMRERGVVGPSSPAISGAPRFSVMNRRPS